MIKFPSLDELLLTSKRAFMRFPFAIISSIITAVVAIYLIEYDKNPEQNLKLVNLMLTSALGIPLYIAIKLYNDKYKSRKATEIISNLLALVLLFLVYLSLPETEFMIINTTPYIKYAIYNVVVHLLVAFLPYINKGEENGFWNYNKTLFLRILEAILYSGVLYLGVVIAIFAVDTLFELDIDGKIYAQIFVFLASVFNTWFFASKMPTDFEKLQITHKYPKGLKVFSQFILLPLLLTYLVILYSYEFKIIVSWDWPKGIVSYLVIVVATIGILTFLLIHPYGNSSDNKWIKRFTKSYYLTLIPLVTMLYFAIIMRISDYGVTINRYIVFLLGLWLLVLIVYFLIGKTSIKFIPISLAVMLVLSSFGPWGMFSISENSQLNRLDKLLKENSLLENGKIVNEVIWVKDSLPELHSEKIETNINKIDSTTNANIISLVRYIITNHDFNEIAKYFKQDLESLIALNDSSDSYNWSTYRISSMVIKTFGLTEYYKGELSRTIQINSSRGEFINIEGYQKLLEFSYNNYNEILITPKENNEFEIDNEIDDNNILSIQYEGKQVKFDLSSIFEISTSNEEYDDTVVNQEKLTFKSTDNFNQFKLEIENVIINNEKEFLRFNGRFFVGKK
ncbi:MAG: DUF4153 domain-containing protein [Candidatus Kapaibacterium sp.]